MLYLSCPDCLNPPEASTVSRNQAARNITTPERQIRTAAVDLTETLDTNEECGPVKSPPGCSGCVTRCSLFLIIPSIPLEAARLTGLHVQLGAEVAREETQRVNNVSAPRFTGISLHHRRKVSPNKAAMETASWCFSAACRRGDRAQKRALCNPNPQQPAAPSSSRGGQHGKVRTEGEPGLAEAAG